MIKLLYAVIAIITIGCQNSQISSDDTMKYQYAFDYVSKLDIINKSGNGIYVSDTLVYFNFANFWEFLIHEEQDQTKFVFKLDSIDNSRRFESQFIGNICDKIISNEKSKYSLFFSKIYENMLIVELIDNRGNINQTYNQVTAFNQSLQFLFKFDSNNQITHVFELTIAYD